jgi:hypothetical protein
MQVSAKNLDGPTYVCKDNTWGYTYRAQSCYSNGQYAWTCTNCEIWDDVNQQWVTSLSSSEGSEYEVIRFSNSTGYYATISVYAYGPTCMFCICDWTKYVAIYGPPAEANISGFDKLMHWKI